MLLLCRIFVAVSASGARYFASFQLHMLESQELYVSWLDRGILPRLPFLFVLLMRICAILVDFFSFALNLYWCNGEIDF